MMAARPRGNAAQGTSRPFSCQVAAVPGCRAWRRFYVPSMWPWQQVLVDAAGVKLGVERFAFGDLVDAACDGTTLVMVTPTGRQSRVRVRGGLALLEKILDGIASAHPGTSTVYRTPDTTAGTAEAPEHQRTHRLRRRTAQVGSPDLWIGRTLYR